MNSGKLRKQFIALQYNLKYVNSRPANNAFVRYSH